MPQHLRNGQAMRKAFLAAYEKLGNISAAAKAVPCDRRMHYKWLDNDKDGAYREAFNRAKDTAIDALEEEARRRAVDGIVEPVIRQTKEGEWKVVGGIRKYSDTLLMFLLNGARPETYKFRHEHTGKVDMNVADFFRKAADRVPTRN